MLCVKKISFTFVKSLENHILGIFLLYNGFMKDRIKQIMEAQHMTQQTFANFIGMSPASLSSIFNDRTKPTINTVEAIKSKMPGISTDWLLFGRGTMFVDDKSGMDVDKTSNGSSNVSEPVLNFGDNSAAIPSYDCNKDLRQHNQRWPVDTGMNINMGTVERSVRKITEIRVFFDDQTYESFVPKK